METYSDHVYSSLSEASYEALVLLNQDGYDRRAMQNIRAWAQAIVDVTNRKIREIEATPEYQAEDAEAKAAWEAERQRAKEYEETFPDVADKHLGGEAWRNAADC